MTETGLDLIEDQYEAELVRQRTQPLEVRGPWPDYADVLQHGLGNERGNRIAFADVTNRLQIVEIHDVNEPRQLEGRACAERAQRVLARRQAWSDLFQGVEDIARQLVVIAVVSPLHHDEMIPARDRAAHANGQ